MKHWLHLLGTMVATAVFAVALWLLWHELKDFRPADIRQHLATLSSRQLGLAVALTVLNYAVLLGYDLLAMRAVGCRLPLGKVALASFTGFALSANLGALLGGTSARVRLYAAWGLNSSQIIPLIIMLGITFWIGVFALAGGVFVASPFPIPPKLALPIESVRPLGLVLLAVVGIFLVLTRVRRIRLHVGGVEFSLPSTRIALAQALVAATDLALAAACLYVLLPQGLELAYTEFLGIYLLGVTAAVITHVPGGVGIFELIVLTFIPSPDTGAAVASLLAFRVIYYLLPLIVAVGLLAVHEVVLRWNAVRRGTQIIGVWCVVAAPWLLTLTVTATAAWLVIMEITPLSADQQAAVRNRLPLAVLELGHLVGAINAIALLLAAGRLLRPTPRDFRLVFSLLFVAAVCSLLNGFDIVSTIAALGTWGLIWLARPVVDQGDPQHDGSIYRVWRALVVMILLAAIWLALWIYHPAGYDHAMWTEVSFAADGPRVLRAAALVGAWLILVGGYYVARRVGADERS